jgi:hypothetical protein
MADETTVVEQAPEATETAAVPTADVAAFCKVISEAFPEDELTTPESCLEKLTETLEIFKKERPAIQMLTEAFEAEPRFAAAISDHATGKRKNMIAALAAHFDPEEFTAGPEDEEELKAAMAERMANKEAMKARMGELDANLEASRTNIEAFMNEKGLTPETIQPFIEFIDNAHKAFYDGKLTKAELDMLWKGYSHDGDVQEAYDEGNLDGKNDKIVETKIATEKTDKLPVVVAASETAAPKPLKKNLANTRWEDKLKIESVK